MKKVIISLTLLAIMSCGVIAASAQKTKPALSGPKAESMFLLEDAAKKIIALAEAVPEDKYSWRPGEGVRSVSEVFMHIAGANYLLPTFIGVKADGFEGRQGFQKMQQMEKITGKTKIVEQLKKSFDHARHAIRSTKDSELDKSVDFFGNKTTYRGLLNILASHCHEHLGQSIAYARINKIVPPWSRQSGS